jgi:hypothetical protein
MRISVLALAVLLGGCAANPKQVEILSSTSAGVEIGAWCWAGGPNCRQAVSDVAQAHCRGDGVGRAQYVRSAPIERSFSRGERWSFVYRCVR